MAGDRWIAVDWGTSRLRAWAMAGAEPTAGAASHAGAGQLCQTEFEAALLALIEPWLGASPTSVVACGMVGSRQGWVEAPYHPVPAAPLQLGAVPAPVRDPRLRVRVLPGLKQTRKADVMRGEETQIAGFVTRNPGWDGVLCLPGTHTKWVQISAGEVVSFQTFLTGELFALLTGASVLRHSAGGDDWDEAAFAAALDEALARPERLASGLFSVRARHLLEGQSEAAGRARLSGLLIGAELAGARVYWLGQQVAIIGAGTVTAPYRAALEAQGVPVTIADAEHMTLAGLTAAWRRERETAR